jgi:type II secretory pathway pseudopilin PulG
LGLADPKSIDFRVFCFVGSLSPQACNLLEKPASMKPKNRSGGFTLVETILIVAMIGIIAAIGVPFIMNMIHRDQLASPVMDAYTLFQRARNRAIRQNLIVGVNVDPSENGGQDPGKTVFQVFQDKPPFDDKYTPNQLPPNDEEFRGPGDRLVLPVDDHGRGFAALFREDYAVPPPPSPPDPNALTFPKDAAQTVGGAGTHDFRIYFRPDGSVSASSQANVPLNVLTNSLELPGVTPTSRGEVYLSNGFLKNTSGNPQNTFRIEIEAAATGRISLVKFAHADPSHAPPIPLDTFLRQPFQWYYR